MANDLFIIAELGVNHDGYAEKAIDLVRAAKQAGADAVKTQVWTTEEVYARSDPRFDTIKRLELNRDQVRAIKVACDAIGIEFFATPDDMEWARFLKEIGVKRMKTSSQDVTNLPFLREIGALGLPVIYSTGACSWKELEAGWEAIRAGQMDGGDYSFPDVLHCVSAYPALDLDQMNLNVLKEIGGHYGWPLASIGLSDHTIGSPKAAVTALALGATIFEKHLTLDVNAPGPDHMASTTPGPFSGYVESLREAYRMLGDGVKRLMPCEEETRKHGQRFAALRADRPAGHRLIWDDLCFMKIGHGVDPQRARELIDKNVRIEFDVPAFTSLASVTVC